jgi:hypothetical protein
MSPNTTACCAVTLNQQQQTNIDHCQSKSLAEQNSVSTDQTKPKYCTVVENGRVIVKPIAQD